MHKLQKILTLIAITAVFVLVPTGIESMSSENYSIFADTVNYGGNRSTDTSFIIFDSIGEGGIFDTSTSTSSNYALSAGYQSMNLDNFISASTSPSVVDLGNLSPNQVNSAALHLQVSTNATFGYSSTIVTDGEFHEASNPAVYLTAVSDGEVTAGSAEYGIRTSGEDGQFNSADRGIGTLAQTVASRSNWIGLSDTTITFKASVPNSSAYYGSYMQNVTITTTPNY